MKHWTPEAEQRLSAYLDEVLAVAQTQDEGAEDFLEDLRAHIRSDAEESAGGVVTPQNLERALAAAGTPYDVVGVDGPVQRSAPISGNGTHETNPVEPKTPPIAMNAPLTIIFGVLLPLVAVGTEFSLMNGTWGGGVGVMPTYLHVILLLGVPAWLLYLLIKSAIPATQQGLGTRRAVAFGLGYLYGISLFYSILLLPLMPISLIAIIWFGIGLIGLSPAITLVLACHATLRLEAGGQNDGFLSRTYLRWAWAGGFFVMVLLGGYVGLQFSRDHHLEQLLHGEPAERDESMAALRWLGMPDMSRYYGRSDGIANIWMGGSFQRTTRSPELQEAYFRIYGEVPTQADLTSWFYLDNHFGSQQRLRWEQGGDRVGTMIPNLSLIQSAMNVDFTGEDMAAQGLSCTEWILEFDNNNPIANEARCLIALPPGGVASRLTLWINGEEREAAFGGRSQVKAAYKEVAIVRRRDPALLTSAGRDQVFLQCFPVPAFGQMKVKIGITAPLHGQGDQAFYRMPFIASENFTLPDRLPHGLNITSPGAVTLAGATLNTPGNESRTVNQLGTIRQQDLFGNGAGALLSLPRVFDTASHNGALGRYVATMQRDDVTPPVGKRSLCLVVDSSAGVGKARIDWHTMLQAFPESIELHAVFAGGEGAVWDGAGGRDGLAAWLGAQRYEFGQPLLGGVISGLGEVANAEKSEVIVIHGPQPLKDGNVDRLTQALESGKRNGQAVRIHLVAAAPGVVQFMEHLDAYTEVVPEFVTDSVEATVARIAQTGTATEGTPRFTFAETESDSEASKHGTNSHLVRLAALDQVMGLLQSHSPLEANAASTIARRCRLVTPVSGAIVLETKAQYERHGLDDDADLNAVPAVPEPEEWLLIIVALAAVCFVVYRTRIAPRRGLVNAR